MIAERQLRSARRLSRGCIGAALLLTLLGTACVVLAQLTVHRTPRPALQTAVAAPVPATVALPPASMEPVAREPASLEPVLPAVGERGRVLLVSIDGMRASYWAEPRFRTHHLAALAAGGVRARLMRPVFPSKTFPNHWSIITGLYPEHHGIVGNNFYDPDSDRSFSIRHSGDTYWWGGEPLWNTCEKQSVKTGSVFWPGSDIIVDGIDRTGRVLGYNSHTSPMARAEKVLEFFDAGAQFVTAYFEGVDNYGHRYGATSDQAETNIIGQLKQIDEAIGRMREGLKSRNIDAHIVVTSDHGMADIDEENKAIEIGALLGDVDPSTLRIVEPKPNQWVPLISIFPQNTAHLESDSRQIVQKLNAAQHEHVEWFTKWDLPARYHYVNNSRIAPILGLMELHWTCYQKSADPKTWTSRGTHGYDNMLPEMGAFFVGNGEFFKKGVVLDEIYNLDVYNLLATILRVKPAPTDGTTYLAHMATQSALVLKPQDDVQPLPCQKDGSAKSAPTFSFDFSAFNVSLAKGFELLTLRFSGVTYTDTSDAQPRNRIFRAEKTLQVPHVLDGNVTLAGTIGVATRDPKDILIKVDDSLYCSDPAQRSPGTKLWHQFSLFICLRTESYLGGMTDAGSDCVANEVLAGVATYEFAVTV